MHVRKSCICEWIAFSFQQIACKCAVPCNVCVCVRAPRVVHRKKPHSLIHAKRLKLHVYCWAVNKLWYNHSLLCFLECTNETFWCDVQERKRSKNSLSLSAPFCSVLFCSRLGTKSFILIAFEIWNTLNFKWMPRIQMKR